MHQSDFEFHDFKIRLYEYQGSSDAVMLIHGWEGQAGNFSALIEKLIERNFTIYAFDGPSHGQSSRGKTSLFEFTELTAVLIKKFGVRKLISHSFGGVATSYALSVNPDIAIDRYVMLTAPDKFSDRINYVSHQVGISESVKQRLITRIQKDTDMDVAHMNTSEFVQRANVAKALILQDRQDRVVTLNQPQNIHAKWPQSSLEFVEGTGHFKILKTPAVIERTIEFLEN